MANLRERYQIDRPVYLQSTLHSTYGKKEEKETLWSKLSVSFKFQPKKFLLSILPFIGWISVYNWRSDLTKDIIAGVTVGIMNIPQGMAYAILGNVPPVVGIYMAFFPVIIYVFLGTSRHVSMGSFAVVCLMTGKVVLELSSNYPDTGPSPIEVCSVVTFIVGVYQITLFFLRLGIVSTLLSDTIVHAFTSGAAIHVFSSQIPEILGLTIEKSNGPFHVMTNYGSIIKNLHKTQWVAVTVSAVTLTILILNNELLKPWVAKKTIIPVPMELIVVLAGTLLAMFTTIAQDYGLKQVGSIELGLPEPRMPDLTLFPLVAIDCAIIASIAYIISLSMALIFAKKLKYIVDPNQELLAQGAGNVFGSFFSCMPFAASLSRSVIQQTVGGVTQIASIVSCIILLLVLLWIGPFFEPLLTCVLSSLVVVALKNVIFQVFDLRRIWKSSRLDGMVWIVTYLSVILIDIDIGLLVGVTASLLSVFIRGIKYSLVEIERIPNTDLYVDTNRYTQTEQIRGVVIIKYNGCINYINRSFFQTAVLKVVLKYAYPEEALQTLQNIKVIPEVQSTHVRSFIVMELSGLAYLDPAGVECLGEVISIISTPARGVLLAELKESIADTLMRNAKFQELGQYAFPTVHDAVLFAESRIQIGSTTVHL